MAKKKIVNVDTEENREKAKNVNVEEFKPTEENKKKATKYRIIAFVLWIVAFIGEGFTIYLLTKPTINTALFIGLIVGIMVFAIGGSLLWKKANRLDPASKKNKVKFFIQNQLGLIMTMIAFLPLVVLIFADKEMGKKQKGIIGSIAVVALVIAGYFGLDLNAPSIEEYTEQTQEVVDLTGQDYVFWTKSGTKYHLFDDCYHINQDKTTEIAEGTVAQARALKNITELCKTCKDRWLDENPDNSTAFIESEVLAITKLLP
ncbi:MAG: hypothetical protein ACK5KQ_03620 [Anaerorhabdus sp.]